jgi:hypothetical protein
MDLSQGGLSAKCTATSSSLHLITSIKWKPVELRVKNSHAFPFHVLMGFRNLGLFLLQELRLQFQ